MSIKLVANNPAKSFSLEKDRAIRVDLPNLRQWADDSCGPAILRSITQYYGVGDPDEDLYRKALGTTPEGGTTPPSLIVLAKKLGLQVRAKTGMSLHELCQALDDKKPVVCAVQAWGNKQKYKENLSGHYLVAIGYDDIYVYFMDPAIKGARGRMTHDEFLLRWHDEDLNGKPYNCFGMVVWAPWESDKESDTQIVRHVAKLNTNTIK